MLILLLMLAVVWEVDIKALLIVGFLVDLFIYYNVDKLNLLFPKAGDYD